jgi:hypothetical protein
MGKQDELIDLGLAKQCSHVLVSEMRGQIFKDFCGSPTLEFGGKCYKHDTAKDLVQQERVAHERTILAQKRYIEDILFPRLTKRIEEIINSDESKDADVIKIWQTTMDRIGLAAVQGLIIEGNMKVDAPLDILRAMLQPVTDMDPEVLEAELIEDNPSALGPTQITQSA